MFWFGVIGVFKFFWVECFGDCCDWGCIWIDVGYWCVGDVGLLCWGIGGGVGFDVVYCVVVEFDRFVCLVGGCFGGCCYCGDY